MNEKDIKNDFVKLYIQSIEDRVAEIRHALTAGNNSFFAYFHDFEIRTSYRKDEDHPLPYMLIFSYKNENEDTRGFVGRNQGFRNVDEILLKMFSLIPPFHWFDSDD